MGWICSSGRVILGGGGVGICGSVEKVNGLDNDFVPVSFF